MSKPPNFAYRVAEHSDDTDRLDLFSPHTGPGDLGWVAEDAAKNYHKEHDGWESNWPLTFVIYDVLGNRLGSARVDRESVPSFRASDVRLGTE